VAITSDPCDDLRQQDAVDAIQDRTIDVYGLLVSISATAYGDAKSSTILTGGLKNAKAPGNM